MMSEVYRTGSPPLEGNTVALEIRDVTVKFGGFTALDSVSLTVRQGSVFGIVGPNGAGKSTLVDVICGFQRLTKGRVSLQGRDLVGEGPSQRARRGLVRTFQTPRLFNSLTVSDHLSLARVEKSEKTDHRNEEVRDALESMRLADRMRARADSLAGGQRKLLDLVRALAQEPSVLVLDEPVAGVASKDQPAVARLIENFVRTKSASVILIEHNLAFLESVCDTVAVLDLGRVIAQGDWAIVKRDEKVVRAYLGAGRTQGVS